MRESSKPPLPERTPELHIPSNPENENGQESSGIMSVSRRMIDDVLDMIEDVTGDAVLDEEDEEVTQITDMRAIIEAEAEALAQIRAADSKQEGLGAFLGSSGKNEIPIDLRLDLIGDDDD